MLIVHVGVASHPDVAVLALRHGAETSLHGVYDFVRLRVYHQDPLVLLYGKYIIGRTQHHADLVLVERSHAVGIVLVSCDERVFRPLDASRNLERGETEDVDAVRCAYISFRLVYAHETAPVGDGHSFSLALMMGIRLLISMVCASATTMRPPWRVSADSPGESPSPASWSCLEMMKR